MEEDVPQLAGGAQLKVLEGRAGVAQLNDEEAGVVEVAARRRVELEPVRVVALEAPVEGLVGLEQRLGRAAGDDVALLVDDEAGDVGQPLRDEQLTAQLAGRVRLLVDQARPLLRLGLRPDWRLEPDHLDDARAALVSDAIHLGVRRLGDLLDPVARRAHVVPGQHLQVGGVDPHVAHVFLLLALLLLLVRLLLLFLFLFLLRSHRWW